MTNLKQSRREITMLIAVGLTGYANIVEGQHMTNTIKHFNGFSELRKLVARIIYANGVPAGEGPLGSYPIPVLHQGQIQIAFMIYRYALLGPNEYPIWPPTKIMWFDPVSGKLIADVSVTPNYFGQKDDPGEILGNNIMAISSDTYDNFQKRLPLSFDTLFPIWAANPSLSRHIDLQNQAREFLRMFDQVCEQPLRPYYYALGRDWFGWLQAVAQ